MDCLFVFSQCSLSLSLSLSMPSIPCSIHFLFVVGLSPIGDGHLSCFPLMQVHSCTTVEVFAFLVAHSHLIVLLSFVSFVSPID